MEAEPETKVVPLEEQSASGHEADARQLRRQIGRYEVLHRLGHGGMATVYMARATGSAGFEKLVALKVIHPHLAAEPNLVEMFLDEARIAAQIHNPHVVEILDLGHERGDYYMVMEFVDGETLSALIRKLRATEEHLPLAVVLQILIDACEGLRAAHELRDGDGSPFGVIHRDVSPQNLLIDLDGWVRIVDFGIMKAKGKRTDTRTGQLRGKLPYMSPEQAESRPLTPACDLFALGVVLWELCTGERLFAGKSDVETLAKVVACERPSLASVRPDLPEVLETVLEKTLARDPSVRYSSAAQMGKELRLLLRDVVRTEDGEPRALLAAIMREGFGEQSEYRRAMTRRDRPGRPSLALVQTDDGNAEETRRHPPRTSTTPLGLVPAASGFASAEPTTGSVATSLVTGLTTVRERWWGAWIALPTVGALIAVVILVSSGLLRTPEEAGVEKEATTTNMDELAIAEGSLGSEVAQAESGVDEAEAEIVRWVINSDPDGAMVRISGASPELQAAIDDQLSGRITPLDVQLPRSEVESLTLEVYMSGYQATTEKRLPLVTENLRYVLRSVAPVEVREPIVKSRPVRISTKPKKDDATPPVDDPLPPPTFDRPLIKKRTSDEE